MLSEYYATHRSWFASNTLAKYVILSGNNSKGVAISRGVVAPLHPLRGNISFGGIVTEAQC